MTVTGAAADTPTASPGAAPPDVVAAVLAAVDAVWPRPVAVPPVELGGATRRAWRFSGRWWHEQLVPARTR